MKLLPQNSRKITAVKSRTIRHANKYLIVVAIFETILLVFLVTCVNYLYISYQNTRKDRVEDLKKLVSWERLIDQYPNYPDIYYNAAVYAVRTGDREKALNYINKSILLNPNFKQGKQLQEEILGE